VHLTGRACIDGGTRASLNADLAAGARSALLIVDHIPTGGEGPLSAAAIRRDADALAASGTRVVMIQPDAASQTTLERPLDPGMLVAAGAAGRRQGREEAARVAAGWR
jgi:NTE family protein